MLAVWRPHEEMFITGSQRFTFYSSRYQSHQTLLHCTYQIYCSDYEKSRALQQSHKDTDDNNIKQTVTYTFLLTTLSYQTALASVDFYGAALEYIIFTEDDRGRFWKTKNLYFLESLHSSLWVNQQWAGLNLIVCVVIGQTVHVLELVLLTAFLSIAFNVFSL